MKKALGLLIACGCFINPLLASDVENLELQFWDSVCLEKAKESGQPSEESEKPESEPEE